MIQCIKRRISWLDDEATLELGARRRGRLARATQSGDGVKTLSVESRSSRVWRANSDDLKSPGIKCECEYIHST
jgi:hypothetical protein